MVDIIRSIPQLERERAAWDRLAAAFRHPLLEHDWFACCARALHREDDLRVVVLRSGGQISAVAPLVLEHTPAGIRLGLLGSSSLHEPGGLLFDDDDALRTLLAGVTRVGPPVFVHRVPADSPLCHPGLSLVGWSAVRLTRMTKPSLTVPISGTWDVYFQGLSTRITENLPRRRRKAERDIGRVEATVRKPTSGEVPELLSTLVKLEASGWKGRNGSALLHRPGLRRFFAEYSARAAARNRLRVAMLTFGGVVAAIEFSVEAYARVWQLKIGFEEAVSSYYPGLQLTQASIKAAFDAGVEAYEFLGSAEPWEERWNPVPRAYALVAMYPFGFRGVSGAVKDFVGALSRRAERVEVNGGAAVEAS